MTSGSGLPTGTIPGNPVNETVGIDRNGDRDAANFDRPVKGRDDLTRPIVSKVDSTGTAIRNGIKGTDKMLLDLRLQYVHRISGERTAGVFWEIYNALNRVNFGTRSARAIAPIS